ncbi:hypothetical protein [Mycolicibacterium sp. F2034L]|uniref:hypothetical protein n=1 Tax=Mycolicibacterium sp. F2034L TaxID=2926422 RepID=UPI001FF292E2|nr:hypothetical protein [Mycolicibacterium sp. F2034L]MCK0174926.1 hypothetical protein [Mycolicibacterium sp. F2034L]
MARKSWKQLPPAVKAAVIVLAVLDAGLRAVALRDLSRRDGAEVNGPRWLWKAALGVVTSSGVLPVAYLLWGRTTGVDDR